MALPTEDDPPMCCLDGRDRALISLWKRKRKIKEARVAAGRILMASPLRPDSISSHTTDETIQ